MSTAQNTDLDSVMALLGYDQTGNLRVVEADGWWEQAIAWAADPVRLRIRLPVLARPANRAKKPPITVDLTGAELTEPSAL
jgi:hypothetical protein